MIKQYITPFSWTNSKAETVINEKDIDDVFETIYILIISNIYNSLGKGPAGIIDSVIDHNISKYNPLAGSSYIKLPKELKLPKKSLINI